MSNKAIEAVLERVNALLSRTPDAGLEMAKIILLEENEKYFNKPTHRESHQDAFQCGYLRGFREAVGLQSKSNLEESSWMWYSMTYENGN
jgi:hypothetical protein